MLRTSTFSAVSILAAAMAGLLGAQGSGTLPGLTAQVATSYKTPGGQNVNIPGNFYRSHDGRTREDSGIGATITDTKAGTVTVLNPATKQATIYDARSPVRPKLSFIGTTGGFAVFGHTTVEGHLLTQTRAQLPNEESREVWTAQDIGLPMFVKVSSADHTMTRTLSKVSVQEPAASVFAVPSGYTITHETGAPAVPPVPSGHKALVTAP